MSDAWIAIIPMWMMLVVVFVLANDNDNPDTVICVKTDFNNGTIIEECKEVKEIKKKKPYQRFVESDDYRGLNDRR